jgi:hypothetical protein
MFQFDTKLFTLQLNGCLLFDYSTKRYFIREKTSRVQRTKFYESHSYFGDALGPIVKNKNESREKWRPFY